MSAATTELPLTLDRCVVRDTASRKGRTRAVEPGTASSRHLHYGRIILDAGDAPVQWSTGEHETGLIALNGAATAKVEDQTFAMNRYDALYVPRECRVEIVAGPAGCDLAELSAPVIKRHPVQFV